MCVAECVGKSKQRRGEDNGAVLVPQMCTYMRANNMTNQRGWTDPPFFQSQCRVYVSSILHLIICIFSSQWNPLVNEHHDSSL